MASSIRRAATRAVAGTGLLLTLCIGVAAGCASGLPDLGATATAARTRLESGPAVSMTSRPPAPTTPRPPVPTASPTYAPTASPTKAPTPPPPKPTRRPTADPNRLYHVPILMYHRIIPTAEAGNSLPDLVVSPETFSAQLKALHDAGWHSITLAALASEMEINATVPAKTFVITIDDGWSDGYEYAFPIMRRYGFVGTYFVVSSRIDGVGFLSTHELRALEAGGNEIGNHTVNHVSLSTVSLARVKEEVEGASEQIAVAAGHRPLTLAYPMGGVSTAVASVVSAIPDMTVAVTTHPGKTETWLGRYDMPRVRVHPTTDPARLLATLNS